MNRLITLSVVALFFLFASEGHSQEITKYSFLEVIIVQKANNRGKVKRIKVEEQTALTGQNISIKEIEKIEQTSTLLNYMNANNWEFLDHNQ